MSRFCFRSRKPLWNCRNEQPETPCYDDNRISRRGWLLRTSVIVLLRYAGGLCYAEMGSMLPVTGGSYAYVSEACKSLGKLGDVIRFMMAWGYVTLADPMTATLHGLTMSTYLLGVIYPTCSAPYVLRVIVTLIFTCKRQILGHKSNWDDLSAR